MIDIDQAQRLVLAHVKPLPAVTLPISEALFSTLAETIYCDIDQPPFDRSVMDGYAVRAADTAGAPVSVRIVGQIPAGSTAANSLKAGEAMQINTGAPVPAGADAVVPVEETERTGSDNEVLIRQSVSRGEYITPRATYTAAGAAVLHPGTLLTPVEIGVAATVGAARVRVHRRPSVASLATGDELVAIDQTPVGAQIRDSNQYALAAMIASAQAEPFDLGVAGDDRDALRVKIVEGLRRDVLCITGGISMGTFDYVPEVLLSCGATFHIHKMATKPGRPTIFATMPDGTAIFALPGNPLSALVGFELLVRPALAAMQGRSGETPPIVRATLCGSVPKTGSRRAYHPARVRATDDGRLAVHPLSWHGSGDSIGVATANAFIMRPPGTEAASDGDGVLVVLPGRL